MTRSAAAPPSQRPAGRFDLVAVDVDGTLLRPDKSLSQVCARAVTAATARDIKVVLASARPPRSLDGIHQTLNLDTPTINYNGSLIRDPLRNATLRHRPLPPAVGRAVVEHARHLEPNVVVSLEILDQWWTDRVDPTLLTETAKTFEPDVIAPLDQLFDQPITKLMLLAAPPKLPPIRHAIEARFADQLTVTCSDDHLIQILAPNVDKGEALAWLAKRLGVNPRRVLAIGDAPNDVPMLQWAGLGLAMASGWPQAIAASDALAPGNDADGLAVAIQQYVLQGDRDTCAPRCLPK